MSVIISDDFLQTAKITPQEIKQEIAVFLFQKAKITLAQAASFAEINRIQFQHLLASRDIAIHYDITDFEQDLKTVDAKQKWQEFINQTYGSCAKDPLTRHEELPMEIREELL